MKRATFLVSISLILGLSQTNITSNAEQIISPGAATENLQILEELILEGAGSCECRCEECPNSEFGCYYFSYSSHGTQCPGNEGYELCGGEDNPQCDGKGPGWIEEHVTFCNGPCGTN